jgi:hypothetical protein
MSPESNMYKEIYDLLGFKRVEEEALTLTDDKDAGVEDWEEENGGLMKVLRENFFPQSGSGTGGAKGTGAGGHDDILGLDGGEDRGGQRKGKGGRGDVFGSYMADFEELERLPKISDMVGRREEFDVEGEAEPKLYDDAPPVMSPLEEKIIKSIEMEKKCALHKSACIVLCSQCNFLEFPGCGTHKQLLSVRKKNGHGKCAKCTCSTDTNGPWYNGCRICKSPTRKLFWSISIREAQFLLRAFPTDKRR